MVAICRLKRVAADAGQHHPSPPPKAALSRRRILLVGAGPGVARGGARPALPLGYTCVIYDADPFAGGDDAHADPEIPLAGTCSTKCANTSSTSNRRRASARIVVEDLLALKTCVIFVSSGAPRELGWRSWGAKKPSAGYPHRRRLAILGFVRPDLDRQRVIVLGGGNTAMDCCRTCNVSAAIRSTSSCAPASRR